MWVQGSSRRRRWCKAIALSAERRSLHGLFGLRMGIEASTSPGLVNPFALIAAIEHPTAWGQAQSRREKIIFQGFRISWDPHPGGHLAGRNCFPSASQSWTLAGSGGWREPTSVMCEERTRSRPTEPGSCGTLESDAGLKGNQWASRHAQILCLDHHVRRQTSCQRILRAETQPWACLTRSDEPRLVGGVHPLGVPTV